MIDFVFLAMFVSALVFIMLTVSDQKNPACPCLAILFLAMCMVGAINIETGYTVASQDNIGTVTIVSGMRTYDGAAPLAVVFLGLIIIMIVYMIKHPFEKEEPQ